MRDDLDADTTLLSDRRSNNVVTAGEWTGARATRSCASWTFADFAGAIAFVNRVAELAERANHHPDMLVHGWNKVRLTLSTHSEGGLTDADFELARADRSPCTERRLASPACRVRPSPLLRFGRSATR